MLPFDLHVLGLPLAFILSQDQTLRCNKLSVPLSWNSLWSLTFKGICLLGYYFNLSKNFRAQ